jgi:hypothetical protein
MSAAAGKETTEPDDLNVGLIATITIVGALLVIAIAAALTALVRSESSRYGEEVGTFSNLGTVARLKAEQRAKLEAAPSWADKDKGLVALPIDRAMELVTADIKRDPNLATPTPPAPPAPAPTAAEPAPQPEPAKAEPGKAKHENKDKK